MYIHNLTNPFNMKCFGCCGSEEDEKHTVQKRVSFISSNEQQEEIFQQKKQIRERNRELKRSQEKDEELYQQEQQIIDKDRELKRAHQTLSGFAYTLDVLEKERIESEDAAADKLEKLHEKDGEILQLKKHIREKDRELHRANETLLSSKEAIDGLEKECIENDAYMPQLLISLNSLHREYEGANEEKIEKDGMIRQLMLHIREKDVELKKANQTLLSSKVTIDGLRKECIKYDINMQQLGKTLKSLQKAFKDATAEKYKLLHEKDRDIHQLKKQIREKDREFKRDNQTLLSSEEKIDVMSSKSDCSLISRAWECKICKKKAIDSQKLEGQILEQVFLEDADGQTWNRCISCNNNFHLKCVTNLPEDIEEGHLDYYLCDACGWSMEVIYSH